MRRKINKKSLTLALCGLLCALCVYAGTTTNFHWDYGTRGQKPWWNVWTTILQSIDTELYGIKHGTAILDDIKLKGPRVDVRAYGAVGNGTTNDKAAVSSALSAAIAAGKPLYFPAGTWLIEHSGAGQGLAVTGDLVIYGDGKDQTIIQFAPNVLTYQYDGFALSVNTKVTFRDLTIRGSITQPADGTYETKAIRIAGGDSSETRLERVRIDQYFVTAMEQGGNSDSLLQLDDCYIFSARFGLAGGGATSTTYKRFHAFNTHFAGLGSNASATCHLLYPGPNVSLKIIGSRFSGTYLDGYAIHSYGTCNIVPKYLIIDGCVFDSTVTRGIFISQGTLQISNCRFYQTAAAITLSRSADTNQKSNLQMEKCDFASGSGSVFLTQSGGDGGIHNISNCTFDGMSAEMVKADSRWKFSNCYFLNGGLIISNTYAIASAEILNCKFTGKVISPTYGIIAEKGNRIKVAFCEFTGDFYLAISAGTVATPPISDLIIEHCDFRDMTAGYPISIVAGLEGKISGFGNLFNTTMFPTANGDYQLMVTRNGVSPDTVASNATVSITDLNHNTFHITETAGIATLQRTNSANGNLFFTGPIYLIADAAWNLENTGNIKPKTTAARTQYEMVGLTFDPKTELWYEMGW
jgi:hypothetical protein